MEVSVCQKRDAGATVIRVHGSLQVDGRCRSAPKSFCRHRGTKEQLSARELQFMAEDALDQAEDASRRAVLPGVAQ